MIFLKFRLFFYAFRSCLREENFDPPSPSIRELSPFIFPSTSFDDKYIKMYQKCIMMYVLGRDTTVWRNSYDSLVFYQLIE